MVGVEILMLRIVFLPCLFLVSKYKMWLKLISDCDSMINFVLHLITYLTINTMVGTFTIVGLPLILWTFSLSLLLCNYTIIILSSC